MDFLDGVVFPAPACPDDVPGREIFYGALALYEPEMKQSALKTGHAFHDYLRN